MIESERRQFVRCAFHFHKISVLYPIHIYKSRGEEKKSKLLSIGFVCVHHLFSTKKVAGRTNGATTIATLSSCLKIYVSTAGDENENFQIVLKLEIQFEIVGAR